MKKILTLIITLSTLVLYSQTINIQSGTTVSTLYTEFTYNGKTTETTYDKLYTNNFFIGVEYLKNNWFNISTNFGAIIKGDKYIIKDYFEKGDILENGDTVDIGGVILASDNEYISRKNKYNYITFNTCVILTEPKTNFFLSVGLRIDYMVLFESYYRQNENSDFVKSQVNNDFINKISYGGLIGIGSRFNITEKYIIGVRGDYYLNISKMYNETHIYNYTATTTTTIIFDRTFTINLTLSYIL